MSAPALDVLREQVIMSQSSAKQIPSNERSGVNPNFDWVKVAYYVHLSRAMDEREENELVPSKEVLYQFSARGHDVAQIMLASQLTDRHDAACGYYRSRPLLLTLGVPLDDAMSAPLAKSGGYSDGRDIGVVFNFPNLQGPSALPMCGGVGTQYTPSAGWAQAIEYHAQRLKDKSYEKSIAVVLGGDASVATNGFWAALTMATTLKLPMLFYIEDNGFGISVRSDIQTPGCNIAANLASFKGLTIHDGDGTDPLQASELIYQSVSAVRDRQGPVLLRLRVPRLAGHSAQDTQRYKSKNEIAEENSRDPLPKLKKYLVPAQLSETEWHNIAEQAQRDMDTALAAGRARPVADPQSVEKFAFSEVDESGVTIAQTMDGILPSGHVFVLEHRNGLVLFDAGMDPAIVSNPNYVKSAISRFFLRRVFRLHISPKDSVANKLDAMGESATAVRKIIVSHLHFDHIGCIGEMPQAELIVSRAEWEQLSEPYPERDYIFREHIELPDAKWTPIDFAETNDPLLAPFGGCYDVMGDGSMILLPTLGHTPGSLSMLVQSDHYPPLLLIGDLTYDVDLLMRDQLSGIAANKSQLKSSFTKVRALKT